MITIYKKELRTKDNISNKIDNELIHYRVNELSSGILKFKKNELEYIKSNDVISYIEYFFKNIEASLNLTIYVKTKFENDIYNVNIDCDDNSKLIGKDGNTLKSFQLLLHQIISNLTGFNIKINVDCANYRMNKIKKLEKEINNICNDVISSRIEAKLDPMNSYQRRIVHNIANSYVELKTISEGTEPNRYIIISYKED